MWGWGAAVLEVMIGVFSYTLPQYISRAGMRTTIPAMSHTVSNQKPLLARIRRIKGQTQALERALEEGQDCAVVLQQLAAVRGAVNGLMLELLEGHVREHLGAEAATAEQREQDLELVVKVLRSYVR